MEMKTLSTQELLNNRYSPCFLKHQGELSDILSLTVWLRDKTQISPLNLECHYYFSN